jgi:hypothetical protein
MMHQFILLLGERGGVAGGSKRAMDILPDLVGPRCNR